MHTEIKLNWDFSVHGREITGCWLTRWQSLPGVFEIVLWRISSRPASSHICKLPQTRLRRCAPAPGTHSHSETAWKPGQLVSARETDAGADTTRNSWQQEHTSQSQASSQTAARAAESPDMAVVPIKTSAFCCWKSLIDVPETELAACNFGKTTQCEEAEEDDNIVMMNSWQKHLNGRVPLIGKYKNRTLGGRKFSSSSSDDVRLCFNLKYKAFFFFNQTKIKYLKC